MPLEHLPAPCHGVSDLHTPHSASPIRASSLELKGTDGGMPARMYVGTERDRNLRSSPEAEDRPAHPWAPLGPHRAPFVPPHRWGSAAEGVPSEWAEGGGSPLLACIHTCIHTYIHACARGCARHTRTSGRQPAPSPPPPAHAIAHDCHRPAPKRAAGSRSDAPHLLPPSAPLRAHKLPPSSPKTRRFHADCAPLVRRRQRRSLCRREGTQRFVWFREKLPKRAMPPKDSTRQEPLFRS
ncbi:uncharacterized protein LOC104915266 [Meleagris gallopavo]|uniref:uncharacterized protein LOC104915266 n=1 Tax=Meleagris gallopavo TaxID=9103 RepID=UPI000549D1DC|nr:uncharacterized protein LOC104915266 [Meleagris gallopavo]